MADKMINVVRLRNSPYVVNYRIDGNIKRYVWSGSRNNKQDIRQLPESLVNHLLMSSRCFTDGELKILEDTSEAKEIVENIDNKEAYVNNTNSREDIIKLLNSNINYMKGRLNKITVLTEKNFVIDVAKEINLDSATKRAWLAEWLGVPVDVLFEN